MPRASAWIGFTTFKAFGLTEPTGIDLPGEGKGQFHKLDVASDWNEVALATASFGQRFTVTPIQMLNMVCAIVDDGKLKSRMLSRKCWAETVRSSLRTRPRWSVRSFPRIPPLTCARTMEQVVANGTGKNAYVPITASAARLRPPRFCLNTTVTARCSIPRTANGLLHRRSADGRPADRGFWSPSTTCRNPATHSGGTIAAPVVGRIMEDVLPYIGITPVYDDSESDRRELTVPSVSGKTRDDAISTLSDAGFDCIIKGDGDTVTDQVPNAGMRIAASGKVIVYMGEEKPTEAVEVPDLSGMLPDECRDTLEEYGLYPQAEGCFVRADHRRYYRDQAESGGRYQR